MDELENRLRGIKLAEPPLGFDPDEVAGTAAKKLRNRRGVVATGVATLAVIAAAVVFVAPGDGPVKVSPAAPTSSALPPQVRPDENTPLVDLTAQKARNLEHLQKTVMTLLPGATEFKFGKFEQDYYPAEWDQMTASVRYRDASNVERGFNVTLTGVVSTKKGYSDRAACPGGPAVTLPDGTPLRCEVLPQSGGTRVVIMEKGNPGADLKGTTVESVSGRDAIAFLPDGTAVTVTDLGALSGPRGPSLNDQQLLRLVLDPELTLR
ncbi:hypothetical protein [Amycolatopsis orientalis]|uniref:hypothetical protein n=1 Tax=Amycolatopsis orientalis TaxID=31958 RepID=UPI00041EB4C3|nr:hypothetical protein [Amycolatopsis orientalis]